MSFRKYQECGAYHWKQIARSVRHHNAFVNARYDAILAALGDVPHLYVLDLGCGDGVLSYLITQQGAQVTGVDTSHLALCFARHELTRRGVPAHLAEASAYALPFPSGTFDAIVCSDVIEHVRHPEQLVEEANRVLRSGGRVIVTTPLRVTEIPLDKMHVREFFPSQLATLLASYFADVSVMETHPLALLELFNLPVDWLGHRTPFRYLFNAASIYLKRNPFLWQTPFRYFSMLVATGQKV